MYGLKRLNAAERAKLPRISNGASAQKDLSVNGVKTVRRVINVKYLLAVHWQDVYRARATTIRTIASPKAVIALADTTQPNPTAVYVLAVSTAMHLTVRQKIANRVHVRMAARADKCRAVKLCA